MKHSRRQNRQNYLAYTLPPVFWGEIATKNVVHSTGMVWSGGINAAATTRA